MSMDIKIKIPTADEIREEPMTRGQTEVQTALGDDSPIGFCARCGGEDLYDAGDSSFNRHSFMDGTVIASRWRAVPHGYGESPARAEIIRSNDDLNGPREVLCSAPLTLEGLET